MPAALPNCTSQTNPACVCNVRRGARACVYAHEYMCDCVSVCARRRERCLKKSVLHSLLPTRGPQHRSGAAAAAIRQSIF